MIKKKIKKIIKINIILFLSLFFIVGTAFGAFTSYLIGTQTSDGKGSYNSVISFTGTVGKKGYYVNNKNNSAIISNYFTGYYFDSLFGFFKLDWSSNESENVRIVDSTNKCDTGYGYKLGGKAYSELYGYINFNYNPETFVYYCLDTGELYGKAYGKNVGYQNFEGIEFSIVNSVTDLTETISSEVFANDTTIIDNPVISNTINNEPDNGSFTEGGSSIGGDLNQIDVNKESLFYIIK